MGFVERAIGHGSTSVNSSTSLMLDILFSIDSSASFKKAIQASPFNWAFDSPTKLDWFGSSRVFVLDRSEGYGSGLGKSGWFR